MSRRKPKLSLEEQVAQRKEQLRKTLEKSGKTAMKEGFVTDLQGYIQENLIAILVNEFPQYYDNSSKRPKRSPSSKVQAPGTTEQQTPEITEEEQEQEEGVDIDNFAMYDDDSRKLELWFNLLKTNMKTEGFVLPILHQKTETGCASSRVTFAVPLLR
jgi:hypothetical protein